ncbi:MAG: hypothetical protein A2283_02725 [Lentisphaerae bacterium RIFOXYA12_FULL_48_11]|nr:MAG: hypothetical protein A2283_02725 [Lentisphaerae bacterium RIFOXYA12_FULL_48_11]
MKKRLPIILVIIILLIAVMAIRHKHIAANGNSIKLSGNIEITDAELSFRIPGRVEARLVSEGETVKAKQLVAKLDSSDLTQEVAMRKAEESGASAVIDLSRAEEKRLRSDFARQKELFEKKVISNREFEVAETAIEAAMAKTREAEARLEQIKQALILAEIRLGYTRLTAPFQGLVLSDHIETGEYVVPGTPVVTVGNIENVWMRGYINESDLGHVKVGQTAKISTDSYPGKTYDGKVSFISPEAEFTPKNVQTAKERTKLVYRIKIDIPNLQMELKPGMPADALIQTETLVK